MKKLIASLLVIVMLTLPSVAMARYVTANQVTVGWDAVTYTLESTERLVYEVAVFNNATDPGKENPIAVYENVEDTQFLVTMLTKGFYAIGVRSVVQVMLEGAWINAAESEYAYSDVAENVKDGEIFILLYYPAPDSPTGLRDGAGTTQ